MTLTENPSTMFVEALRMTLNPTPSDLSQAAIGFWALVLGSWRAPLSAWFLGLAQSVPALASREAL